MKAILAMDSYNRGYGQGIDGLSGAKGTKIGNATISQQSDTSIGDPGVNASFYGIAYDYDSNGDDINDETIIAYRGTDNLLADANNG